ncbi:MAG: hypothetical protein KBA46_04390 [Candidatus Omnitrophica bacterium]|nr:hypothetical protein [Candidatus Omnitrophota bacterium]
MNRARTLLIICLVCLLVSGWACASDDGYRNSVQEIIDASGSLVNLAGAHKLSFNNFDTWYKDFKKVSGNFRKDFFTSHKDQASFRLMQESLDMLGSVWNTLRQAQDAEAEYQETITAGSVEYAYKWKNQANEHRKKATELVLQALDLLKQVAQSLDEEY